MPLAPQLPVPAAPGGPTTPQAAPLNGQVIPPAAPPSPQLPATIPPAPMFYDVTVVSTRKMAQARVMGVAPEEFGIERGARSLRECNYCYQDIVTKTESDLIAEGYDEEQVRALLPYTGQTNVETLNRDTVQEHMAAPNADGNEGGRLVIITEHYVRLDRDDNGKPQLYQVVTGGDKGEIMRRNGKDCVEPFDVIPFAAASAIPITHRFVGRSIADIVIPAQREKTALKRGALDNLYLHNNPRVEVAEQNAGPNTLDDLLVSRPGGVIRTKTSGGVNWQVVPDVTSSIFPAMQYLDAELEARTGMSKQTQGIDANALQNQSATAVAQVFSASQMRVKLLARIIAEGVRDVFSLLHATIRKHGQQAQTVRLRNKWIDVDPREWKTRDHMTINVGLGTGGKAQQFAQTMAIANVQKEMVAAGMTNIVGQTELYNTASELTKIMGHKSPNRFFKDPDAKDPRTGQLLNPPPPPKPDPKTQAIQAQSQATMQEAQQRSQLNQQETQLEAELTKLKAELEARMRMFEAALAAKGERRAAHHDNERHRLGIAGDVAGIIAHAHSHDTTMAQKRADHQARMEQAEAAAQQQSMNDAA